MLERVVREKKEARGWPRGVVPIFDWKGADMGGASMDRAVGIPRTLMEAASRASSRKTLESLIETEGLGVRDEIGATALHRAAQAGNRALVRLLIARGADVSARDDLGATALHRAAESGSPETISELIRRGADPEARDLLGRAPGDIVTRERAEKALRRGRVERRPGRVEFLAVRLA